MHGNLAILSHPRATFRALALAMLSANLAVGVIVLPLTDAGLATASLTMTAFNVGVAALVRQQYVVNTFFRLATGAPRRWPLRVRAALAEVYQYGGAHVGCALAATGWFLTYAGTTVPVPGTDPAVRLVALAIAIDLVTLVVFGLPSLRRRFHDIFESTHRLGGWTALALFAGLTVLVAGDDPRGLVAGLVHSPAAWVLLACAVSVVIPWLQLRSTRVSAAVPSDHVAVLRVDDPFPAVPGSWTRIARSPFGQSHAFAAIPSVAGGYRLVVSRAGDWTANLIDAPPRRVWVRGVPVDGVASVVRLFGRVVWVATGSGIAPCLPHLLAGQTPSHLVWVTRNPGRTYGSALLDEITRAAPDAQIWDTDARGKPDLTALAASAYHRTGAEAVVVISNQDTTQHLVAVLRGRGIAAYGPIWDS